MTETTDGSEGLRTKPSKLEAMATGKNAMTRFADEKPKSKTPAPKPGRVKVSDGAKALAAFNRTSPRKETGARRRPRTAAGNDRAERTLAEQPRRSEAVD
jgi:hypothetical protein